MNETLTPAPYLEGPRYDFQPGHHLSWDRP